MTYNNQSSFWLFIGENRDLLEDRRTANVISVTSQSQPFQNFQQRMAFFVCIDRDHVITTHYKTLL